MRLLRRPFVCTQIEIAGSDEAIVAQDLLDVSDRTAIEQECRRHRVAEHVCG